MKPGIEQRSQGPMETQPCGSGWRKGQETRTCGHCSSSISTMLHFNVCLTSLILFVTLLIKMFNYFVLLLVRDLMTTMSIDTPLWMVPFKFNSMYENLWNKLFISDFVLSAFLFSHLVTAGMSFFGLFQNAFCRLQNISKFCTLHQVANM